MWPGGDVIVDADVFAAAAQRALRSGAVEDYGAALKLYAGELLPEDRYADWAAPHRERLAALHEALTAGQARALLERRRPEEAVALLEPLVADRPNDEPLHRVLMEALEVAGRRWDALDVYERLYRVLDEEYAAAPEAATLSLYRRILSGRSSAGPAVVSNLPAAVTSFIGRRREIAELLALADRTRLLTLSGPGGAGKTRLAIEVARRLANADAVPDGVWLVDLSGVRDGRLIPAAAAASLGLALTGTRPTTAAVVEQLADRRMVVLLDNCEHLLAACAEFAMALLERCAGVAVLATSREPLRLPGEVVWRVPSLELPDLRLPADPARLARLDSVQLFLERAANASPAFRLDSATALPVARICLRLDGIPLALELAASRIAHLAAAELADRLDDVLATLAGRIHGVPDRQATLTATLDWSHDLLAVMSVRCFVGCRCSLAGSPSTRLKRCVRAGCPNRSPRWCHGWWTSLWLPWRRAVTGPVSGCLRSSGSTRSAVLPRRGSWPATSASMPCGTPAGRSLLTLTLAVAWLVSRARGSRSKAGTCGQRCRRHCVRCQTVRS